MTPTQRRQESVCKIRTSWPSKATIAMLAGEILKFVITAIIISCKFFFLFIGRELTTWPADNCLQIMVCSCAMSFNCVWLQIIFCSYANSTALFSFLRLLLRENGRYLLKNKLGDRMMEQLSNPIIAVFSRRSIMIYSPLIKSPYFAQPRPIIV